jgi:hypothetical protein
MNSEPYQWGKSVFDKGNNKKDLVFGNTTPIFSITGENNGLAHIINHQDYWEGKGFGTNSKLWIE